MKSPELWSTNFFLPVDIDECGNGSHDCHQNAICTNTAGLYNCSCLPGYIGDGSQCRGIVPISSTMEVEIDLAFVCSVELQRRLHNEIKINNNKKIIKNNNNKIIIRLRLRLRHEAVFFAYFFKKMIRHPESLTFFPQKR